MKHVPQHAKLLDILLRALNTLKNAVSIFTLCVKLVSNISIDCDNALRNGGGPAPNGNVGCNMACNGNSSESKSMTPETFGRLLTGAFSLWRFLQTQLVHIL